MSNGDFLIRSMTEHRSMAIQGRKSACFSKMARHWARPFMNLKLAMTCSAAIDRLRLPMLVYLFVLAPVAQAQVTQLKYDADGSLISIQGSPATAPQLLGP